MCDYYRINTEIKEQDYLCLRKQCQELLDGWSDTAMFGSKYLRHFLDISNYNFCQIKAKIQELENLKL